MCDVQAKLVAWLDRELPESEAGEVERHVENCKECRGRVEKYEQVSAALDVYCDAVVVAKSPRRIPHWMPVVAGAVIAAAVLFLAVSREPRPPVEPRPVLEPTMTSAAEPIPAPVPVTESAPRERNVHKRHVVSPVREYASIGPPADAAIEIAIPAESMFPPGAMPSGLNFIADLRIAPDGSVKQVRLRQ